LYDISTIHVVGYNIHQNHISQFGSGDRREKESYTEK